MEKLYIDTFIVKPKHMCTFERSITHEHAMNGATARNLDGIDAGRRTSGEN